MSISRHRTAIEGALITALQLDHPGMVVIGENSDQKPVNEAWVRMSLTVLEISYPCINNTDRSQTDALFNIQIFTPLATGAGEASTLADEIAAHLKAANLPDIAFFNFDMASGVRESEWYVLLLRATYRAKD